LTQPISASEPYPPCCEGITWDNNYDDPYRYPFLIP